MDRLEEVSTLFPPTLSVVKFPVAPVSVPVNVGDARGAYELRLAEVSTLFPPTVRFVKAPVGAVRVPVKVGDASRA